MAPDSDCPPMGHSAAYYERRTSPTSPTAQYQYPYPPISSLSRPSVAHVSPHPRSSLLAPRTDPSRVQSSVSSGESGSSACSDYKNYLQSKSYQFSPRAESGIMGDLVVRQTYQSSQAPTGVHMSDVGPSEMIEDNTAIFRYIQEDRVEEDNEIDHALWILFWMSLLDPVYCLFSAIVTVLAILAMTLLLPLQLCRREYSPSISLVRMVAPVFRNHLQMIVAKSLDDAHTFEFSPWCLIFIHLVSPILSIPNAVAAWVVAVFWVFAIIMGNPDGTEKRDDGRAAVLMLRDWWEKCLLYATRK